MKSKETIEYQCQVVADVFRNGVKEKTITATNILTNLGKLVMLSRLCDPTPPYAHLNHMIFGNSTYEPTVLDNFDDFGDYYVNNTRGYKMNMITEDSVEVFWELQESEYNGYTIKSLGLASDDYVFNRVLFYEEDFTLKDPSVKIVGKWVIRILQS